MSAPLQPPATIGFVGLGNMGRPMVTRLAAAGYQVAAFDAAPAARDALAATPGVTIAGCAAAVADDADAVILMLPDSAVVARVLEGDGLLAAVPDGGLIADMSSSEPARTRELAKAAAGRGVTLIDAPVSGGVAGATAGSLTIMTGGAAGALERLAPVLDVLGSKVVHAGDIPGAGHAVKALNNLMSAAHLLASSEAILAGQAFGLDPAVIVDIVSTSSGRSGSVQNKWPNYILPERFDSGFSMAFMVKDMAMALGVARDAGVPAPLGEAALAAWQRAVSEMPAGADHTEIALWLAR